MDCVPSCVASQLEEVHFVYHTDKRPSHYHLAKFLLKNGRELKRFRLFHFREDLRSDILEKVSAFAMLSTCLNVTTPSSLESLEISSRNW